ncbi:DUF5996 family protein [Psychroflexus montanilacus]|uniref:DUF5996 family protein n=1 Tax=Psychroflexus montanilacus TaxID=2873598 RepID=UPI001CCB1E32|nr:DUF5996 family protein [Psychroflexus montanilacus]MBZ9650855.1 DUF5996 family protein [Psychroflexus montanilacus]
MENSLNLPELTYIGNEDKKMTLHLFLQIMGKIRLKMTSRKNHWWYVTEYVNTQGLTTGAIPYNSGLEKFSMTLNVIHHKLEVSTSKGELESFSLHESLTVADFYNKLLGITQKLNIPVSILDVPFGLGIDKSFGEINEYQHYDKKYTENLWRSLLWVDDVFTEFSGRFYGKTCPVHLYWHSMDLAVTRFSGNEAPPMGVDARLSDKDAYSHECISFGFWAGDDNIKEPAFYSYTYPSPKGLDKEVLFPSSAEWVSSNGSAMAILKYNNLLAEHDPRKTLLDFMESAYQAGAKKANWDLEKLHVPPLDHL